MKKAIAVTFALTGGAIQETTISADSLSAASKKIVKINLASVKCFAEWKEKTD